MSTAKTTAARQHLDAAIAEELALPLPPAIHAVAALLAERGHG